MNALRHGLRSEKAVLPDENQEDFNRLHAGLQDLYQPQTVAEQDLVEQAVISKWKLVRAEEFESECYHEAKNADHRAAILNQMTQIQTRLERSYFKAYKELERIKASRAKAAPQAAPQPVAGPPKEEIVRRQVSWQGKVLFRSENGVGVDNWSDPDYVFPLDVKPEPDKS
ncbi:MAG: hypothetical protein ABSC93_02910 [Bryobacteraceae bacterium]|jgi:hypothetical protein